MSVVSSERPLSYVLGSDNPVLRVIEDRIPNISDVNYEIGTIWISRQDQNAFILISKTVTSAMWKQIS